MVFSAMATTSSYMVSTKPSMLGYIGNRRQPNKSRYLKISAQQQQEQQQEQEEPQTQESQEQDTTVKKQRTVPRPVEPQPYVKSKNMAREYGSEWLSSTTRHVRIYAAYIDPVTCEFDQTQTDKLTLILDPTNEFVWNSESCTMVYSYFQELVDHYEGADLTEYTLRLIGSDIEHYIRKMLFDGDIQYNMDARVLNFSMGKPRIMFNNNEIQPQDDEKP